MIVLLIMMAAFAGLLALVTLFDTPFGTKPLALAVLLLGSVAIIQLVR